MKYYFFREVFKCIDISLKLFFYIYFTEGLGEIFDTDGGCCFMEGGAEGSTAVSPCFEVCMRFFGYKVNEFTDSGCGESFDGEKLFNTIIGMG